MWADSARFPARLYTGLGVEGVKVHLVPGSTACLAGLGHFMVPHSNFLSFVLKCYYQRVSSLIITHLRKALQTVSLCLLLKQFASTWERAADPEALQQEASVCSARAQPPPSCPQLPLCFLISSSSVLLEGPSPPFFWRLKELEMKISLFCAPSYEKWVPQMAWWPGKGGRVAESRVGQRSLSQQRDEAGLAHTWLPLRLPLPPQLA